VAAVATACATSLVSTRRECKKGTGNIPLHLLRNKGVRGRLHTGIRLIRGAEEEGDGQSAPGDAEVPTRAELIKFAAPLAAVSIAGPVLSAIDTAFVGRCAGTLELAALGPACTVADLIYLLCCTIGTAAIRNYANVGEDEEQRKRLGSTCIVIGATNGALAAIVSIVCCAPLLAGLSATPAMIPIATDYIKVRAIGLPFASVAAAMYGLCVGQNDTRTPFIVTVVVAAMFNIAADWLFCAIAGWGAAGAAWATVAAQLTSLVAYVVIMRHKGQLPLPKLSQFQPSRALLGGIMEVYLPVSAVVICVLSMYACMSAFVNRTQPVVMVAAYKVIISVFAFVALCADPMAAAATTKLPPILTSGSRSAAHTFTRRAASCAAVVGIAGASLGAAVLRYGAGIFTKDTLVASACKVGLVRFMAILSIMHPTRVFQNSLLAHGDYGYYMVAQAVASTLFFVGLYRMGVRAYRLVLAGKTTAVSAYTSMWSATLIFYTTSFFIFAARAYWLNKSLQKA